MTGRTAAAGEWVALESRIVGCERCPRLRAHCADVARTKRRAYRAETYWGRPVPGFGDPRARILLLGLAPAAHGANRTGRMFTGDRSGDWLYGALHRRGWSDRAASRSRDDGLKLSDVFISAACRCAPPDNRPAPDELERCAPFLDREFELLRSLRVAVALGRVAWDAALRRAERVARVRLPRPRPRFAHGAVTRLALRAGPPLWLVGSYHPSQQNTQTGRLTRPMLDAVLRRARTLADQPQRPAGHKEKA
jgi:uracil-DNA glycosylase family 4